VVKYHGLGHRHLARSGFLVRPLLNGGTLGGRRTMAQDVNQDRDGGALFQDVQFEVTHLCGTVVDQLLGVIAYEDDLRPALILLKPSRGLWQWFYLDVGAGFWEQWPDSVVEDVTADDAYKYVDYADLFGLRGADILEVTCEPVTVGCSSQISVRLSCGTLLLSPQDANDFESSSVVSFTPRPV
jgi:hypothetical protein